MAALIEDIVAVTREQDRGLDAEPIDLATAAEDCWGHVETADATRSATRGRTGPSVYVAGDGRGIPPDERDRVFESGYSSTSDGTGLGLSIVEDVAAHDWTVTVTDGADGGARFEITAVERVIDDDPTATESNPFAGPLHTSGYEQRLASRSRWRRGQRGDA